MRHDIYADQCCDSFFTLVSFAVDAYAWKAAVVAAARAVHPEKPDGAPATA